jgi:hypothetical protein
LLDRQGGRHWYAWSALAGLVIAFSFGLWMSYKPSDAVPLTSEVLQAFVGAGLPGLWGAFLTAWSLAKLGIAKFPPEDA